MSYIDKLKNIEKKFPWSFLGFFLAFLALGYAIYVDFIKEEKPEISFEILSSTNVLDVKEDISKLDIIYAGENLKEKNKNLRVITIKIVNNGETDIKESDFASNIALGLKIDKGKIAKIPDLLETSNNYLKDNLIITTDTLHQVLFNQLQIDKNQYFIIKILIVNKESETPNVIPFGKISGITSTFPVKYKVEKINEELSFFEKLNFGSFWIHIVRCIYYTVIILIVIILIFYPFIEISEWVDSKSRKKKVKKYREINNIEINKNLEIIFDIYLEFDDAYIFWLSSLLSDIEKTKNLLKYISFKKRENKVVKNLIIPELYYEEFESEKSVLTINAIDIIRKLRTDKIIIIEDKEILIDESFKKCIKEFQYFLKTQ